MGMEHCKGGISKSQGDKIMIPLEDLLAELEKVSKRPDGSFTTRDVMELSNHSQKWCLDKIHKWRREGIVECIGSAELRNIWGRMSYAPLFRAIKKDDKTT